MSQYNITPTGGGGSGINITADTGGMLGPSASYTFDAISQAGSTVSFSGSGTTVSLNTTDGSSNTIVGLGAGNGALAGSFNTAFGSLSFQSGTTATSNVALGAQSIPLVTTGTNNVSIGTSSLTQLVSGAFNIAIGDGAGSAYTTNESENIVLGGTGVAGDANQTWIGFIGGTASTQTACFIDGISGVVVAGVPVLVSGAGQLGVAVSSERFKQNIQDMGDVSNSIYDLRPTTFSYKADKTDATQYGLIAEEVAKVMPNLVVYDQEGLPQTVKYQDLPVLLLNEIQKLKAELRALKEK